MRALPELMAAKKSIPVFPGWSPPEPETGYSWFDAALEVGGVVETGFVLHGGCYINRPDCNLTFEIRIGRTPGRHCVPVARFCWRSLKGGHTNPKHADPTISRRRLPATHLHPFELNWSHEQNRMLRGNCRYGIPITKDLQTFEQVRSFVGIRFRINNIAVVTRPEWDYTLPF